MRKPFNENRGCIEIYIQETMKVIEKRFNENRGCIEMPSRFLPRFYTISLMKTEVVLKL